MPRSSLKPAVQLRNHRDNSSVSGIDSAFQCLLQIIDTMVDLKEAGVDILTFGQYLQPTPQHLTVKGFITPEKFEHWRKYGEQVIGFRCCCRSTAPVVCSSAARLPTQICIALGLLWGTLSGASQHFTRQLPQMPAQVCSVWATGAIIVPRWRVLRGGHDQGGQVNYDQCSGGMSPGGAASAAG